MCCGGTLVRASWDVCEKNTGKPLGHFESYHIDPEQDITGASIVRPYTPYYAEIGNTICVDAGNKSYTSWATWESIEQICQIIDEEPERMIYGYGPPSD